MSARLAWLLPLLVGCFDHGPRRIEGDAPSAVGEATSKSASPDDVWLAFGVSGTASSIWAMRADGSQLHQIPGTDGAASPTFSSNGRAMAYAAQDGIMMMDLSNGISYRITDTRGDVPTFSPDGTKIAFVRDVDIWIVDSNGRNERRFVEGPPPGQEWYSNYGHPVFTHDGTKLVYDRRGAIEIGDIDGTDRHAILEHDTDIMMPAFSPDWTQLAVSSPCGYGHQEIVLTTIDTAKDACTSGHPIAGTGGAFGVRPAWSANGLIAYAPMVGSDLFVVPAIGGQPKNVMSVANKTAIHGGYIAEPAWSPPGARMP